MADSIHEEILDAYETTIRALNLDGTQQHVYRRMALSETWTLNIVKPCVVIMPAGIESIIGGTTQQDDLWYPVTVLVVDNESTAEPIGKYLKWRKLIRKAFHEKRLSGVTEVMTSLLQPSPSIEPELLKWQVLGMPLAFQVQAEEIRT